MLEKNDSSGPHKLKEPSKNDESCPICLEDFDSNPDIKIILLEPCFHVICYDCLIESCKQDMYSTKTIKCPLCRTVAKKFYSLS